MDRRDQQTSGRVLDATVARNATLEETGYLKGCRYVLHDRDKKFCADFRDTLAAAV